ncbi:MAG TPA: hypothetical protein PKD78_15420 [Saprospiraceae bacterium]|nr:hypothetical protein [Saprospiraceae bacterium]
MMTLRLLFCLLWVCPAAAQVADFPPAPYTPPTAEPIDHLSQPMPRLILQVGLANQWIDPSFHTVFSSVEWAAKRYHHVGLQYVMYVPAYLSSSYTNFLTGAVRQGLTVEPGSFEVSFFSKHFFHGRFTGRKSSIYIGPELRFGQRKYTEDYIFDGVRTPFQGRTVKVLTRLGMQRRIGNAVLELALPMGIEREKNDRPSTQSYIYQDLNGRRLVLLPTISLGYSFLPKKL